MICAMIFDLDGTLVKTERMKAFSYARAAIELCPRRIEEAEVLEAFKEVVGRSRREVAIGLMERFGLEAAASALMVEFGVETPWQAFVQVRLDHCGSMLADPEVCLVIEDSPKVIEAALNAGMWCIAVTTPFTRDAVHSSDLLDEDWIVDEPNTLSVVAHRMMRGWAS